LKLFNDEPVIIQNKRGQWEFKTIAKRLEEKHNSIEKLIKSYESLGYKYEKKIVSLTTPLVIGLGNEHPTEKGFRFDWTLGIPMIPSSSIKGVVRLAYLVNELNKDEDENRIMEFINDLK